MNNPSLSNRCIFGTARLHDLGGCRADQKVQTGLLQKEGRLAGAEFPDAGILQT